MSKVEEPPRYRVQRFSVKDSDAHRIEEWMNDVSPDYQLDQTIQQGDDVLMILRYWQRRRLRRRPVVTKVAEKKTTKKKTTKKEATK